MKRLNIRKSLLLTALVLTWAAAVHAGETGGGSFANMVDQAEGGQAWRSHQAVRADFTVHFGQKINTSGTMTLTPSMSGIKMTLDNGATLTWDGNQAWITPVKMNVPMARFQVKTWPYFLSVPFKLRDPGVHLKTLERRPLRTGETLPAAKMTFGQDVGDTPDDWYILFRDPHTNRLAGMAYVVTYGKTPAQVAHASPHAITYEHYRKIDGVTLPTLWRFWHYDPGKGIHGKAIGEATLSHVRFLDQAPSFARPRDARAANMPK